MGTQVKICGLTRFEDVETSIFSGADYLGFIVEAKSKRRLSVQEAADISRPAKYIVPRVAVTVNADDDLLKSIMELMDPDYIQCHGDETPERVAKITKTFGVKVIKAVPISLSDDMKTAEAFSGVTEFVLYDAKPPQGGARGGHGTAFDWQIIKNAPMPKIFALAGGLTPDNARQALTMTNAPILDVSSGVEQMPGLKDPRKIRAFMDVVRNG